MAWTLAVMAARAARIRGLFTSMPPTRLAPSCAGSGSWSRMPPEMKLASTQSSVVQNRSHMPASRVTISGKRGRDLPRRQLWRAVPAGAFPGAEHGAQGRHVQPGASAVEQGIEDPVHLAAVAEQQVAAVFGLVDRVIVAEPADALLGQVQAEAQAGGVDPPVADLAQPPYYPGPGYGLCDLSQALRIRSTSKTVALLGEPDPGGAGGDGDVLVAVEDHLGGERRMPGHLDRHVSPLRVHDVERV